MSRAVPEQLLQSLLDGSPDATGLDETAHYCAVVGPPLGRHLRADTWLAQVEHDGHLWLLAEVTDPAPLAKAFGEGAAVAVGLPRQGSAGALRSLEDAGQVLPLAERAKAVVRFADAFVDATILTASDELGDACALAQDVARRSPHLADAVQAFAEEGLSVVGASRALQVHANTVIYRLERWQQLTGWDARTFAGLSRSVAALTLRGGSS